MASRWQSPIGGESQQGFRPRLGIEEFNQNAGACTFKPEGKLTKTRTSADGATIGVVPTMSALRRVVVQATRESMSELLNEPEEKRLHHLARTCRLPRSSGVSVAFQLREHFF